MRFFKKVMPKLSFSVFLWGTAMFLNAQDAGAGVKNADSQSGNELLILTGIVIIILAFVIWGLGQVLVTLGQQLLNKNKATNKTIAVLMITGLSLLSFRVTHK